MDYASATPLDKRVLKAMLPYLQSNFGNPSAIHTEGLIAKQAISDARESVARTLNIKSDEVYFTGSGTESDNLAILGTVMAAKKKIPNPHVIMSNIEHPAIMELAGKLKQYGCEVTQIPVNEDGEVNADQVIKAVKDNTVLVSIMYANNEIGTIQPVPEIGKLIKKFRTEKNSDYPYFHSDASQAANYRSVSFQKLGTDLLTLDGSKIYGPKGVGVLALRRNVVIEPILSGGGQEKGLRSGTENVASIVGFAKALEITDEMREKESERISKLKTEFETEVLKLGNGIEINGAGAGRIPNISSVCFPGADSEFAVIKLDRAGISASSGSACNNISKEAYSYVISALGEAKKRCSASSIRFSFGRNTTRKELILTLQEIRAKIL